MIISSKFNGFHNGVRRCFGGGGGGGGGDGGQGGDGGTGDAASATGEGAVGPGAAGTGNGTGGGGGPGDAGGGGPNDVYTPTYPKTTNTGANTNFSNTGNTSIYSGPGVSTPQGMATLSAMKGTPWAQSGSAYNELLNQGFTSDQIKNSASTMYGAPSDSNWGMMVQNAAMTSPTRRPMAGSDQFFQPVYQSSYQNFARPATQFDTSTYGTQPVRSPASASGMSRSNINRAIDNFYNTNPLGRDAPMSATLDAMRSSGINRSDIQQWGGVDNYGPQQYNPYAQTPYNPYTGGYGMGSGFLGANQGYGSGYGAQAPQGPSNQYTSPFQYSQVQNPFTQQQPASSGYGGLSSLMPQMQNPFMQPRQSQQTYPTQSNPYTTQSSQYNYQPNYQPPQQYNPYQQYDQSLGSYNPYQMQSPFSYQQPSYGGYGNYGRGNFIPDAPLPEGMMGTMGGTGYDPMTGRVDLGTAGGSGQYVARDLTPPPPPPPRSSGPTTPIVGRSSGFRGTPNVMRRAEGGIIDLMEKK